MSNGPNQNQPPPLVSGKTAGAGRRLWPWLLLQFLPSVVVPVACLLVLTIHPRARTAISPPLIVALAVLYWYVLSLCFFRSRGKSVRFSLLAAVAATLVVLAANVILILGIVFVGCLVVVGGNLKL